MMIKKQHLAYSIGLFLTQSFLPAHAVDPGALNPAKPSYQLPSLPSWQAAPSNENIRIERDEQSNNTQQSSGAKFLLKTLQISGNKSISQEELQAVVQPFIGTAISRGDLDSIRQQLLKYYRDEGFVYASVTLPDQHISQGLVKYQINEGKLSAINVKGSERLKESYIRDRVQFSDDEPLQQTVLLERFQQLLADPLIERVNGVLKPGAKPGDSVLDLEITRAKPYELYVGMDNYTPASVGAYTGHLGGVVRNLTGYGDFLQIDLNGSEGMQSISSFFSMPFGSYGTRFNIGYQGSLSRVTEGSLDELDIENQFMDFNVGISQPILRSSNRIFNLELQYAFRQTQTSILDTPISLSDGVEDNGKAKVSVIRFIQSHVERDKNYVLSLRSSLNAGFDAFNATINPNGQADGRYFSWLGQLRFLHKLDDWGNELFLRSDIQLASESLLPLERFALGGINTVRGYRQNELVRDEGYALSVEFRIPLWQQSTTDGHDIRFVPFFDYGQVWNHHQDSKTLYSAGVGLKWNWKQIGAEFYWAQALNNPDVVDQEKDAQDSGIHFQLQIKLF